MSPAYKLHLFDLQDGLCWICGQAMDLAIRSPDSRAVTGDHLVPRSKGGKGKHNNQLLAHRVCNERRANTSSVSIRSALALIDCRMGQVSC